MNGRHLSLRQAKAGVKPAVTYPDDAVLRVRGKDQRCSCSSRILRSTSLSAISRRATTVGLSFSQSTLGSLPPTAIWRARLDAIITSSKRFSTFSRQSSTVTRAIADLRQDWSQRKDRQVYGCFSAQTRAHSTDQPVAAAALPGADDAP